MQSLFKQCQQNRIKMKRIWKECLRDVANILIKNFSIEIYLYIEHHQQTCFTHIIKKKKTKTKQHHHPQTITNFNLITEHAIIIDLKRLRKLCIVLMNGSIGKNGIHGHKWKGDSIFRRVFKRNTFTSNPTNISTRWIESHCWSKRKQTTTVKQF